MPPESPPVAATGKEETYKHKFNVALHVQRVVDNLQARIMLLMEVSNHLQQRALIHDESKLEPPEADILEEYIPKMAQYEFGTSDYVFMRTEMQDSLLHHYQCNRHHPEHFPGGIGEMNLIDLLEMVADWKASTLRNPGGDLWKSFDICAERFDIEPQLLSVLKNLAMDMGWMPRERPPEENDISMMPPSEARDKVIPPDDDSEQDFDPHAPSA